MSGIDIAIRIVALCVALAGAETLHGIARTRFLNPRLGKERAVKLSVVSGSLLAFVVCLLLVPGIGLVGYSAHLALGATLAIFMASFDIALGRWLLRRPWRRIADDFDPRSGNYLVFGLAVLVFLPALVLHLRGPFG